MSRRDLPRYNFKKPEQEVIMGDRHDFASGNWVVDEGNETEFIKRWTQFLEWTRASAPGFGRGFLIRDEEDPQHFISFAEWDSRDQLIAWRNLPEFVDYFSACRSLCRDMRGSNYNVVSEV